jgi:uncharacterized protein (TIGR03083 family)
METAMQQVEPIIVIDHFPELLDALLALLDTLDADGWARPTACAGWSVKDVALHLLGGDVGMLSRGRDGYRAIQHPINSWGELVALLNSLNAQWVQASRRMSPRLLCELLRFTGVQVADYFLSLDPYAIGGPVSWAGNAPAPVWLDLAREYTERWHHQQHIRDAIGQPGLTEPHYLAPVLDTFVRALPHTYRVISAAEGTSVALTISGASGGSWFLLRERGAWQLYRASDCLPDAEVILDQSVAWRLFTKGISVATASATTIITGDAALGRQALELVALIA